MHLRAARAARRFGDRNILDRLPNLRLDPDEAGAVIEGFAFRGPDRLPCCSSLPSVDRQRTSKFASYRR